MTRCSPSSVPHTHRIHGNGWESGGTELNRIVQLSGGHIHTVNCKNGTLKATLCTFQEHQSKNKRTSSQQDRNKAPIMIKHYNEYLNMTSICAVLSVSFGREHRFQTLLHSLHYQLIKGNWYRKNNYHDLNCIQCTPVTNTLRQRSQHRSTSPTEAVCTVTPPLLAALPASAWWTYSARLPPDI